MGENKLRFSYLYLIMGVLWAYSFFSSVISPPFLSYYTFDETFITDSGVFLWYGITPRILDWPASPSVLLYGLLFGISVLYQVLSHAAEIAGVLDVFTVMDKAAYNYLFDREPYILAGRAIRLLIVLAMMIWTLRFLSRQKHPLLSGGGRWLTALVLVSTHLLWITGVVLRPEAISLVFFLHILSRLFFSERLEKGEVLMLSVMFGLVGAERLIFLLMAPLFFSGIFLLSAARWRGLLVSAGTFLLSFLAFCPFVLTDPLIIAKAFFGGILAKVNDAPMTSFFNWDFIKTYFEVPVGYLALGLTFLGIFKIWKEGTVLHRIILLNWLLFLFLVLRSSKIYDPHVLPGATIHLFILGAGLTFLAGLAGRKRAWIVGAASFLIVAGEVFMTVKYHRWVRRDTNSYAAVRWIQNELPADSRLLVNIDVSLLLPPNDAALDRQIEATESADNQLNKLSYLMGLSSGLGGKISEADIPLAASAFAFEDEKLYGLQYRLLRKYGGREQRKRFDLTTYVEDNTLFYHGILPAEARENFEKGQYDYWITEESREDMVPFAEFSESDGAPVRVYKALPAEAPSTIKQE